MKSRYIGIIILVVIIIVGTVVYLGGNTRSQVTLKGYVGGEKIGFLKDKEVQKILNKQYGIDLNYTKAGSIEMVKEDPGDNNFLFPSSQTALEIFKEEKGQHLVKSENIFNSPLVIYSWDIVVDALLRLGIVEQVNNSYYIVDFPRLIDLIIENQKWSDIGLSELYGSIVIFSTDPTKSNSGNMFAGLLANILNNGEVVTETTVQKVLPTIQSFFKRLGYLEHSSSDLFEQYLRTGVGAKPMIVGYENQIVEFAADNPDTWASVKERMRILYPIPTVWSAHPVIALDKHGTDLITALENPTLQQIAWEKHGFRTGLIGVQNDPRVLDIVGIPEHIDKVIPMPHPTVMQMIIDALEEN